MVHTAVARSVRGLGRLSMLLCSNTHAKGLLCLECCAVLRNGLLDSLA